MEFLKLVNEFQILTRNILNIGNEIWKITTFFKNLQHVVNIFGKKLTHNIILKEFRPAQNFLQ